MNKLPKVKTKSKKRLGRGYGSGKGGHTSSRGQKGQKARGKVGILFEGMKVKKSLLRRLPMKRGKDKFYAHPKPIIVKTDYLNSFKDGSKVDIKALVDAKIVSLEDATVYGVKILGGEALTKKLIVNVPASKSATKLIEKAGGKVE